MRNIDSVVQHLFSIVPQMGNDDPQKVKSTSTLNRLRLAVLMLDNNITDSSYVEVINLDTDKVRLGYVIDPAQRAMGFLLDAKVPESQPEGGDEDHEVIDVGLLYDYAASMVEGYFKSFTELDNEG